MMAERRKGNWLAHTRTLKCKAFGHSWESSGFNKQSMTVEKICTRCGRHEHWTGKFVDYPGMEWAEGKASRPIKDRKS